MAKRTSERCDANGNWTFGQWKRAHTALGVSNVSLTYSPSSTRGAKGSLQVYGTGNSGVLGHVDDVRKAGRNDEEENAGWQVAGSAATGTTRATATIGQLSGS